MNFAIVIINWNNADATIACIQAVEKWSTLRPAIWVVDNHSTDGADVIIQKCPNVRLIQCAINKGFAGGNNMGIRAAIGAGHEYVFLLNNDAEIDEKSMTLLLDGLAQDIKIAVIGPLLHEYHNGKLKISVGGLDIAHHIKTRRLVDSLPEKNSLTAVDYVPGTAALIRAGAFKEIGFLDEDYFFSGEMADFCFRVRCHGYVCAIESRASAQHQTHLAGERRETLYMYYSLRNRALYIKKHYSWPALSFWIMIYLSLALKNLLTGRFSRTRTIWLAFWDGVMTRRYGDQNNRILPIKPQ